MAVKRIGPPRVPAVEEQEMLEAIKAEMRRLDGQPAPPGSPMVIAEEQHFPDYVHYYVVWDRFKGVANEIRSSIVFDAVREVFPEDFLRMTVAMGLTSEEAKGMGLNPSGGA